jgi:ABC-type lipoprotein export system ATPase subunit/ABC-type Mn2+/Zn2+ transport system permease subunit
METFNFLLYPFLACLLLILIHAYFGIHILERGIIFVDLALAQFIGVGIALSFLFGREKSLLFSLVFAFLGAIILSLSKRAARYVNIEAFIGVLYIFSFSAAILILDKSPHGLEEFKGIMNGNILWVTPKDILSTAVIYGAVGILHFMLRKRFHALTFEGKGGFSMDLLFFSSFAVVLVKSVNMAGILQVFSFLVVPALIGKLFFKKTLHVLLIGWLVGVVVSVMGIFLSFKLDIPTAPVIVASLACMFFVMLGIKVLMEVLPKKKQKPIVAPKRQGGSMLEINNLKVGYDGTTVMELPHLSLATGEHCLILGASGSGKTTILSTISGLLAPIGGEIVLDGHSFRDLHGSAMDEFRGRHIGIIYQTLHMVSALTVLENLILAQYAAGLPQDRDKAVSLLEHLGIADKRNNKPETLSQGQQQRVAIARATINDPKIIVGDEPTSALDDNSCETVMDLLLKLAVASNASLVIATHDQRIKRHFHKQITLGGAQ